jgi:hypothetical protein
MTNQHKVQIDEGYEAYLDSVVCFPWQPIRHCTLVTAVLCQQSDALEYDVLTTAGLCQDAGTAKAEQIA